MTGKAALETLTEIGFVVLFLLTLAAYARRRGRAQLEIAALFGCVAILVVIQALVQITGSEAPAASLAGALLLLAQPYLLLRVMGHFRQVPRAQHVIALCCLAASWGLLISTGGGRIATAPMLAIVALFVYVEGYAATLSVAAAIGRRGLAQRRLIAVAAGSGLLGAAILLAGGMAVLPSLAVAGGLGTSILAFASSVAYFMGFAPPRWLLRTWQSAEFHKAVDGLAGSSAEARLISVVDYLGPVTAAAIGGTSAIIALNQDATETLHIRADSDTRVHLTAAGLHTFKLGQSSPLLTRAFRQRETLSSSDSSVWGDQLRDLGEALGAAGSVMVTPLVAHEGLIGLLVVLFRHRSLFLDEELDLLAAIGDQAALAIESRRM
jgi:hypothetical protein